MLYILEGGKSTGKEEKIVTKVTELAAGAEAQAGTKINFPNKITAGLGIEGSADASRKGHSILSKAIESTVLTDYIQCAENEARSHIKVFQNCKPYAGVSNKLCITCRLFDTPQFSMLHSEEFTTYLFGGKHNQNSFTKELLDRESNAILLDEFDKPNPIF